LELSTIVASVKSVPAGEWVGYNLTFQAPTATQTAVLPLGYFEGVDLRLSNRGLVKIHDQFCPIAGRVSMNITSVNVSRVPNIKVGERVVVISRNPADPNSVEQIAKQCGTIPYEILVHIPAHLRRVVV
jgi:alanine racemase